MRRVRISEAKWSFRCRVAWILTLKPRKIRWFERPRPDFGPFGIEMGSFWVLPGSKSDRFAAKARALDMKAS